MKTSTSVAMVRTPVARMLIRTTVVASVTSAIRIFVVPCIVASSTSAMIVRWGGAVVRTTSCHTILVTSAIVGIVRAMWWFDAGGKIGRGAR